MRIIVYAHVSCIPMWSAAQQVLGLQIAVTELFHFALLIGGVGREAATAPVVVKPEFDGMGAP